MFQFENQSTDANNNFSNGGWLDDVGGDAIARCSDCASFPVEPECCRDKKIDKSIMMNIKSCFSVLL